MSEQIAFVRNLFGPASLAFAVLLFAGCQHLPVKAVSAGDAQAKHNLLVVMDGLRPDYVRPDLMPNLSAFADQGVLFENHHAVFPTATRVNAASIVTGAYPQRHGLVDNTVYFPEVSVEGLSTSSYGNLLKIQEATGGHLLLAPTLGEILEENGLRMLATSSGSSGSAYLVNHTAAGIGLIHSTTVLPHSLQDDVLQALGEPPEDTIPNYQRNARAVDAYIEYGLCRQTVSLAIIWISDPDHTAHEYGIGHPETLKAIRHADEQFGRILEAQRQAGLAGRCNILVASDHGFATSTFGGNVDALVADYLSAHGLGSNDVFRIGTGFYVKDRNPDLVADLVRLFQETEWLGTIFTRPAPDGSGYEGFVPGTLSMAAVGLDNERGPDVYASYCWTNDENEFGWPGTTGLPGVAGHYGVSPWELHATLIAGGPDFKRATQSPFPTGSVDLAPTLLHLCGIQPPNTMQGRILREALTGTPLPARDAAQHVANTVQADVGEVTYRSTLHRTYVENAVYFDYAEVERSPQEVSGEN